MNDDFNLWKEQVNAQFIKQVGLDMYDLPDIDWWAEYQAGTDPRDMPRVYAEDHDDTGFMIDIFE